MRTITITGLAGCDIWMEQNDIRVGTVQAFTLTEQIDGSWNGKILPLKLEYDISQPANMIIDSCDDNGNKCRSKFIDCIITKCFCITPPFIAKGYIECVKN